LPPQAKKFIGLKRSRCRSCRGVFRAVFFGFFGAGATISVASGAAASDATGAADSDATGAVTSARAVSADLGAASADLGAAIVIDGATRDGGSERAPSVDCGAAAVTVIGGGGSKREGSAAFGTAAVTVIGGATRGGSARAVSTALGAAAVMVADAGGRDVTRDGTLERAGVTYDVAGCTMVATDGS
jgi:hypothetical protein